VIGVNNPGLVLRTRTGPIADQHREGTSRTGRLPGRHGRGLSRRAGAPATMRWAASMLRRGDRRTHRRDRRLSVSLSFRPGCATHRGGDPPENCRRRTSRQRGRAASCDHERPRFPRRHFYEHNTLPRALGVDRMIGHITYLSDDARDGGQVRREVEETASAQLTEPQRSSSRSSRRLPALTQGATSSANTSTQTPNL